MSECIQLSFAVCRIGIYTCFRALCCKGPPPPRPEYDLVCIGLTGSGKTSLLSQLCSESAENIVSTTGFSIKAVPFQNAILNVKELGGADNIRKYWSRYYQGSQGVIFVLDSASSEDDLETARNELHSALQHPQLCTLPFLILANHQDKPAARSVQEAEQAQLSCLSSCDRCSSPLIILVALRWTLSSRAMSLLHWGAQHWTQDSRCGLIRAEERGRITSLDLLATLCLMHPRRPLAFLAARAHCCLMLNLSTRTPRSFSAELLSSRSAPSLDWCLGFFLPTCRTLPLPWWNFMRFLSAQLSSLSRSL
ncbi:uncharacterized protein [Struthio camelus]|uniref:uncharacterized protein isoform X1 n=1 Tax=Struthio camelus TaxID=8801 RepID=UPI0036042CBC